MRRNFALLTTVLAAAPFAAGLLGAQGRVIASCPRATPAESVARPCGPATAGVVRVSTATLVDITGRIARTTITETFENRGRTIGEADFLFPLPNGAAFEELRLEIDGKLVAGEILDASSARSTYERIVRELRDPALVEWAGLGMVRTRIFPFGAGERRTVVVTHRQVLPRDGDALRVSGKLEGSHDPADERATGSFRIRWRGDTLGTPWSPTHDVQTRRVVGAAAHSVREVSLAGRSGDVVAYMPLRVEGRKPGVTVLTHRDRSGEQHAMVIVSPPRQAARAIPRDISLVLDVSGSMRGTKLTQAVAAGHALLATLRTGDRFRLIAFADDIDANTDQLQSVSPATIRSARKWLDNLDARGGTNIGEAMRAALDGNSSQDASRLPLVLLITDGQPTVGMRATEILDSTPQWRGNTRVFTFGVGADVDASLVEQLALDAHGAAQFVRPEESVERAVSQVAERLAAPLLADVRVAADGGSLRQLYSPHGVDLMAGRELVFLARYNGSATGRIRITGTSDNVMQTMHASYDFRSDESDHSFVPRLWAVQRVAALDAERRRHGANTEIDNELRLLGERYGVPTPLTSYLVLEPSVSTRGNANAVPRSVRGAASGIAQDASSRSEKHAAAPPAAVAFESARQASEQRAVMSISAADAMLRDRDAASGNRTQVVAGKLFDLVDSTWTDRRLSADPGWQPELVVRVRAFSPAWTELARAIPSLRDAMALGDRVKMRGARAVVEVTPDGQERIDRATIDRLAVRW